MMTVHSFFGCLLLFSFAAAVLDSDSDESQVQEAEFQIFGDASAPMRLLRTETKKVRAKISRHETQTEDAIIPLVPAASSARGFQQKTSMQMASSCQYSSWSEWGACTVTCGNGLQARHRRLTSGADMECNDETAQTQICAGEQCPLDCVWRSWSHWSDCNGVERSRTRSRTPQQFGGRPCAGKATQTEACGVTNKRASASAECWEEWSEWSGCSYSCGGGSEQRTREQTPVADQDCRGEATQERRCNENVCPHDCKLSDWGEWGICSVTCGFGTHDRSRKITAAATFGGKTCDGNFYETVACSPGKCINPAPECTWNQWTAWSSCSKTCDAGTSKRSRTAVDTSCGQTEQTQTETCGGAPCPVDCLADNWSPWGSCSASCGAGVRERTRTVVPARVGGKSCVGGEAPHQRKPCSEAVCPVDCEWSDWMEWGACSTTCGPGKSNRTRPVKLQANNGGQECSGPTDLQSRDCDVADCPTNCKLSDWQTWGECSVTCGSGQTQRFRAVSVPAAHGGKLCSGELSEISACTSNCPEDCRWQDWNPWSTCSTSCGDEGTKSRNRDAINAKFGGEECQGLPKQSTPCSGLPVCPTDCVWQEWEQWGGCSTTCGIGIRERARSRSQLETPGGKVCAGGETEDMACTNSVLCTVDCRVDDWSPWTTCSASCGTGTHNRSRTILQDKLNGGIACPTALNEMQPCESAACPADCTWNVWSEWAPCTKTCGGGFSSRSRTELTSQSNGGTACTGTDREETICSPTACAVDCQWEEWHDWGSCSTSCNPGPLGSVGLGIRTGFRNISQAAENGGHECSGPGERRESCNQQACPLDCSWSSWSDWTICPQTCGGGIITRDRTRARLESDGGLPCIGESHESSTCNTAGCPRDCLWGPWSAWSSCSKTCGGGSIQRYRDIGVTMKNGGNACLGSPEEEAECGGNDCGLDCEWSDWSEWTACPVSCDGSQQQRERFIKTPSAAGGKPCEGNTTEQALCNSDPCPADCVLLDWHPWSDCSVSCGTGYHTRAREKKLERFGGKACVEACSELKECTQDQHIFGCPIATTFTTTSANVFEKATQAVHADASAETAPCTKERLAATILGSIDGNNISAVIERLMKLKGLTKPANGTIQAVKEAGRKVAEVTGDLKFYTENPDGFIAADEAKAAAIETLSKLAGVSKKFIEIDVTIMDAMKLPDGISKKMKGNINVHYVISVHENDNAGDVRAVTAHILPSSPDKVTAEMLKSLKEAGSKELVQATSLSMKVAPVLSQPADPSEPEPPCFKLVTAPPQPVPVTSAASTSAASTSAAPPQQPVHQLPVHVLSQPQPQPQSQPQQPLHQPEPCDHP